MKISCLGFPVFNVSLQGKHMQLPGLSLDIILLNGIENLLGVPVQFWDTGDELLYIYI